MPRRHAITPARRDHMLANLRAGALYRDAAGAAGIPWSTWTDWCRAVASGEYPVATLVRLTATGARREVRALVMDDATLAAVRETIEGRREMRAAA